MNKAELNAQLANPLTMPQLKKMKIADLNAMVQEYNSNARVLEDRVITEPGKAEDMKATKAGSKRHIRPKRSPKARPWKNSKNRSTVSSALR